MLRYLTLFYITIIGLGVIAPMPAMAKAKANQELSSQTVVIDDDYLMLRDIFSHIVDKNVVVKKAPLAGQSYFINASDLMGIAKRHSVIWQDDAIFSNGVHIVRAGQNIDRGTMEELIKQRVLETETKPYDEIDVQVRLSQQDIKLPKQGKIIYEIERFQYKKSTGGFQGEMRILINRKAYNSGLKFSGTAILKQKVPTLLNSVPRGTIIKEKDVIYRVENINNIHDGIVTLQGDVIGMETKRHIRANSNLQFRDLRMPMLVRKNQKVTMMLQTKNIKITTIGIALDDGARGDIISIKNEKSGIVVDAKVVSPETVKVTLLGDVSQTKYSDTNSQQHLSNKG